jgi:F0F1-type ATP synthase assembly protein I
MNDGERQPASPDPRPKSAGQDGGASMSSLAGVGLQFAATIIVFLFAGQWLDKRLGTTPWLLIVGVVVGASAGFYALYRKLMAAQAREEQRRR